MAQVVIRNLDDAVVQRLKERACRHQRSLEGELRLILTEASHPTRPALAAVADTLRQELAGRWTGDSTELIREDRDR